MIDKIETDDNWSAKNKNISQLVQELRTFENRELIVMVSSDGGETFNPVKSIGKGFDNDNVYCTLFISISAQQPR